MFYVFFNIETGEINRVSNELNNDLNYIEIDKELYVQFSNGEKNFTEYRVIPTPKDATAYELIEKKTSMFDFDVDRSIHMLQKEYKTIDEEDTFIIIQDIKNKNWKAKARLNNNYITFLNQTKDYYNTTKKVYVTQENNPNVLLDVLKIKMDGFLNNKEFEIEFTDKDLSQRNDISLYCATVQENYKHEVRN
jgi:hypothetical protein